MPQSFDEFLSTTTANIPILGFIVNIILSALLAYTLGWIYIKYGNSLSNRKQFSRNFLLLTMTTMLMITVVKSSLALSLGLVGALSVIRFRAAIKEPEELSYLFLAIAIGLGLGADQTVITLLAFTIISIFVIVSKMFSKKFQDNQNLHLTVQSDGSNKINIDAILEILNKNCNVVDLGRLDETGEFIEASFMVEADNFAQLNKAKNELQNIHDKVKITFLDNKGLL